MKHFINKEVLAKRILVSTSLFYLEYECFTISPNVPAYAMFASGIIARSAYHWQIWVEACGGTEQAATAYAVLYDVHVFL